jgi:hypothetical protein
MKLLVNTPSGLQELIEIGEGGGYFDVSRVIWDERTDGVLTSITVGGMVREGDQLVFDSQLFADYETKIVVINTLATPTKKELLIELIALKEKIEALP